MGGQPGDTMWPKHHFVSIRTFYRFGSSFRKGEYKVQDVDKTIHEIIGRLVFSNSTKELKAHISFKPQMDICLTCVVKLNDKAQFVV